MHEASHNNNFHSNVMSCQSRSKFFSLIPFFIESRVSSKYFVLKMELFPEAAYLKMHVLLMGGVFEHYVPVKQLIPITRYDY